MKQQSLLLLAVVASVASGLDLEFDSIECDTTLPAFAEANGIVMTCDGNTRCTFGENATIAGKLYYDGLMDYNNNATMGFASANLQLMTLEYDLFQFLPFNFCGDWVYDANYGCPEDGIYHFQIPYELPEADGINAWFATGWQGVSYIKIYRAEEATSALLAHCKLHFNTYVTDSQESSNWYTLPSAAQVTIVLFSILGALFLIVLCCACRTSGKQEPHPTDPDYTTNYKTMDGDAKTVSSRQDEESPENFERANKISVRMGYNH